MVTFDKLKNKSRIENTLSSAYLIYQIFYREASLWAENCPNFSFFLFGPAEKTLVFSGKFTEGWERIISFLIVKTFHIWKI
jgi:hypothetical protein